MRETGRMLSASSSYWWWAWTHDLMQSLEHELARYRQRPQMWLWILTWFLHTTDMPGRELPPKNCWNLNLDPDVSIHRTDRSPLTSRSWAALTLGLQPTHPDVLTISALPWIYCPANLQGWELKLAVFVNTCALEWFLMWHYCGNSWLTLK